MAQSTWLYFVIAVVAIAIVLMAWHLKRGD
jgi:hypothetical protein